MRQRKWKRLCTFLPLALMLTTLCTLFVGYYRANAAVTNLTLTFGGGNGDACFNASTSDQTSYRTDKTSGWINSATNETVKDVPRTQYAMPANEEDLNLCYDLPTADQVTVSVNHIIYIQYTVIGLTADNTVPTVWLFYTDGTNAQLEFTYRSGNNLRDSYAIVNKAGTVKSIRLDIPANGSSSTAFNIYIGKIYIGPSSGSPVKYTVQYKDAAGKEIGSQSLGYNAIPSYSGSTPTKATVSKQYQYAFKGTWKDATNNSTGLTLSKQRITGNTVYEAEYKVSKVYITFKGRNPSDGTENYVLQEGWVNYNAIPTAPSLSTITAGDYMYVPGSTSWDATVAKATAPKTYTAQYDEYFKVTFLGYDKNGEYNTTLASDYVKGGSKISSKFTAAPGVSTVYVSGDATTGNMRYVHYRETAKNWINNSNTATSASTILGGTVWQPLTIKAVYQTEYAVRYYSEGKKLDEIDWVIKDSKLQLQSGSYSDFKYNGTLPTCSDSNKVFVGWVRGTSSAASVANTGTAQVPGSSGISGATYFHARYLNKSFTGSGYSYENSKPGIVVTRNVSAVDKANHKYKITIEAYSYGKPLGYFDIVDSLDGNFYVADRNNIRVYTQKYAGNGAFVSEKTEITGGGGNGYVWYTGSDHTGYDEFDDGVFKIKYAGEAEGAVKTAYYYIRWLNNASDTNTVDQFRTAAGLNEIDKKGYKLIVEIDAYLDRVNTIGGNNMLLSNPDKAYVKYVASSGSKQYHWNNGSGLRNNDKVNANVEIRYDFVPHDYYMDLYDVEKSYYTYRRTVKSTDTTTYIGLISVLRNLGKTDGEGNNHYGVYANMYTHGNEPFYQVDGKYDSGESNYNTDCDGVHNAWVNITYDVIHEEKGNVYSTVIFHDKNGAVVQTKDATFTSGSNTITLVNGYYPTNYVDFTKDHTVNIKARVYPRTLNKDSFDREPLKYADVEGIEQSYWEKQTESYFFAPRFVVADYSQTAYTSLQRESRLTDGEFLVTKSLMNGSNPSTLANRASGATGPAKIYFYPDQNASDLIYYSFDSEKKFQTTATSQRLITSIEHSTYTTKVINVPKRMDATEVNGTAAKKTISRNFYVIPANVMAYDDRALTFLPDEADNQKWADVGTYSNYYQTSDIDTRETQGINADTATEEFYPQNRIHGNSNAASSRTNNYYVGQTKRVKVDSSYVMNEDGTYQLDEKGQKIRANQNQYGIFTFTGTGFDILSCTGPDTGVLVAAVYEGKWTEEEIQAKKVTALQNILVDTYWDGGKTLYQIPVIKYEAKDSNGNPKHGTYTVYFRAYYHEAFDHNYVPPTITASLPDVPSFRRGDRITDSEICELLGWDPSVPMSITLGDFQDARPATRADVVNGYDVYVDGIRVYNTLGKLSAPSGDGKILSGTSNAATYAAHAVYNCGNLYHSKGVITEFVGKEANPYFFNVSDLLVDSGNASWSATLNSTNSVNGILYIAASMPDSYVDDNGGQSGNNSNNADGLIHSGFHLGMSGALYTEEVDGKFYIYRMKTVTNADGSVTVTNEKERAKHNGQDVYYKVENGKNVYYAGNSRITDVELFAACGQTVCYYSAKYDAIGPENEIYLKKNNGIAMQVTTDTKVDTVHVGLRSLDGNAITVTAWNGSQWVSVATNLKTGTETYFDVTSAVNGAQGKLYLKVTDGTASVVNIKVVGGSKPNVSTRMIMDALEVFKTGGETPLLDEGLKIYHSLNLADDISVNYAVAVSVLEGAEVSYMTVELPKYEGNDLVGTEIVTVNPVRNGNYYYYTLRGLTAVNMNDVLKAELRYFKDGRDYVSATDEYSIARYAYTQLDGTTAPESLKVLCANLLRYGGEAQIYKSYRTDAIVSDEMTDAHCSYLTDLGSVVFGNLNTVSSDPEAPTVLWVGKALNLESRISLVFVVDASGFAGDLSDLSLRVTYVNGEGKTVTREITAYEPYGTKEGYIAYTFSDLLAAELRTPLTVAVYAGEEQVSPTLCYSADTYGNGKPGQLGILCRALFAYADAAEAFFRK